MVVRDMFFKGVSYSVGGWKGDITQCHCVDSDQCTKDRGVNKQITIKVFIYRFIIMKLYHMMQTVH